MPSDLCIQSFDEQSKVMMPVNNALIGVADEVTMPRSCRDHYPMSVGKTHNNNAYMDMVRAKKP
ncbi:MAG: hypothetical protein KJP15_08825 [Gammaproteobacteria bacterium]|nr:hypothetical protein [Gammaproteobacteria bacterium]